MNGVYTGADNIITSLGFTTSENLTSIRNSLIGLKNHPDKFFTTTPVPLSAVDTSRLEKSFLGWLAIHHPDQNPDAFTRIEKIFILSIQDALDQSGIDIQNEKSLLVLSTTKGNINLLDEKFSGLFDRERLYLWKMADIIGETLGFKNRPKVISNACISGALAIGLAGRLINAGRYDNVVVTGGDILSEFVISGFISFLALSPEPCRPFDISRNGLSLGEGCGTMILTSNPGSVKGKRISLTGASSANDANHISGPSRTGEELALAIRNALRDSGLDFHSIDYISTHGTATVFNDDMEAKALNLSVLQDVPVNSFKGYFGHTLGGAGVIESILAVHSLSEDMLFRSAGFNEPGLPEPLNVIRDHNSAALSNILKIASGFGGCNAALVFSKEK